MNGIVVIAEQSFRVRDLDIADTGAPEDFRCDLATRNSRANDALIVAAVNRLHPRRRPK